MKHSLLFCFALFTFASCVHGVLYEPPFCSAQCRDPTNFISDIPTDYGPYANRDNRAYAWAILALNQIKQNVDKISPPGAARIAAIVGTCLYEGAALTEQNYVSSVGVSKKIIGQVSPEIKTAALDGAGYWALRRLFSDIESFRRTFSQYQYFARTSLRSFIRDTRPTASSSRFSTRSSPFTRFRTSRRTTSRLTSNQAAFRQGVAACERVISRYTSDGFTPRGDVRDGQNPSSYRSRNAPQVRAGITNCRAEMHDQSLWQPLCVPRRPSNFGTTDCNVQNFASPWAGRFTPYALQPGNEHSGHELINPPPIVGSAEYNSQWKELLHYSANLGDREKTIAEYWEDGLFTVTPPGHNWRIAADAALHERLSPAETARLLFIVGNAIYDAGIACWRTKTTFDFIRPLQMIQCGITSVNQWRPYQSPTFITPPFAGYTSGHSTFSAAATQAMRLFFGSDRYRGPSCDRVHRGESRFEPRSNARPGVSDVPNTGRGTPGYSPAEDVVLCWNTFSEAAAQSGQSRLFGGIHISADDVSGQALGRKVGDEFTNVQVMKETNLGLSPLESKWLEDVSRRALSVQEMIGMTSSGDSFLVPVNHVQKLVREARLGKVGARKAEALIKSIQKKTTPYDLKEHFEQNIDIARALHGKPVNQFGKASTNDDIERLMELLKKDDQEEVLDQELLKRLERTTGNIETHKQALKKRYTIQNWKQNFNSPVNKTEETNLSLEQEESEEIVNLVGEIDASSEQEGLDRLMQKLCVDQKHWSGTVRKLQNNWRKLKQQSNRLVKTANPVVTENWFLDDLTSCRHSSHSKESTHSGTSVYEIICQETGVTVNSNIIKGLKSVKCDLSHNSIGFRELQTFSRALAINLVIEELDLSDNNIDGEGIRMLAKGLLGRADPTNQSNSLNLAKSKNESDMDDRKADSVSVKAHNDAGVAQMEAEDHHGGANITGEKAIEQGSLNTLILNGNPLGLSGAERLAECLDPNKAKHEFLTKLELSKCRIPDKGGYFIANAILSGNIKLTSLNLSRNEIGNKTAVAFGAVLDRNQTLLSLNLSWNAIKHSGASALADGLSKNTTLQKLDMSWNGIENAGVASFGEALQCNFCLKYLDLSSTRVGSEACLVLAEGIKSNNVLETLLLNNNDFEESGAKHLMTALSTNSSLKYLGLQGANMSNAMGQVSGNTSVKGFNPACPNGQYNLKLSDAAERSVALQLCQLDQQSAFNLMKNIKLNGTAITSVANAGWPDNLPIKGTLNLEFENQLEAQFVQTLSEKRVQALEPQFQKKTTTEEEKLRLVSLICKQYYIASVHAIQILNNFTIGDTKARNPRSIVLFSRLTDAEENVGSFVESMYDRDAARFKEDLSFHSSFRSRTPTGHYEFDFNQLVHRCLAARLMDLARAEIPNPVLRNITYKTHTDPVVHLSVSIGPPEFLKSSIPRKGNLTLDYLSYNNTYKEEEPLSLECLKQTLPIVFRTELDPSEREKLNPKHNMEAKGHGKMKQRAMNELKESLWKIYITATDAVQIINSFKSSPERIEAAVGLFPRLVDPENRWKLGYALNYMEQSCWMWRLGPEVVFEVKHCTMHFFLDLSNSKHEEIAKKLVHYAVNNQENDTVPRIWNLRISGRKKSIQENGNMWAAILTGTSTPKLEFDYFGPDSYQLFGKSPEEVQIMTAAEKLDLRSKQAKKKVPCGH
eukprot:g2557.t1